MPATRKISNISLAANQVGKSRLGKKWFLVWDDGLVIIFLFVLDTTTAPQQEKNHWWSWLKLLQKYQQKNVWISWEKYFTAQCSWSMCSLEMTCHCNETFCVSQFISITVNSNDFSSSKKEVRSWPEKCFYFSHEIEHKEWWHLRTGTGGEQMLIPCEHTWT